MWSWNCRALQGAHFVGECPTAEFLVMGAVTLMTVGLLVVHALFCTWQGRWIYVAENGWFKVSYLLRGTWIDQDDTVRCMRVRKCCWATARCRCGASIAGRFCQAPIN